MSPKKITADQAGKTGNVLVAVGTIILAGVKLVKNLKSDKKSK